MTRLELCRELGVADEDISQQEYTEALRYTTRKAALAGKDESYVDLLLPDVVKERAFSRLTMILYIEMSGGAYAGD